MCEIYERFREEEAVTGYKVAVQYDGKYYSPATGIEYKVGPVEIPIESSYRSEMSVSYFTNVADPASASHISDYKGFTAIFEDYHEAIGLCVRIRRTQNTFNALRSFNESKHILVLKMTLSNDLHYGKYCLQRVLLGKHIDAMMKTAEER
jgi:hypothetical protein